MTAFSIRNHSVVRKIGEGGMGSVYLAVDDLLERQVAIKVLKPAISLQQESMKRFQSEAVTLARLRHPHITMLYNLMEEDGHWCMVMEFVEGDTLECLLKEKGRLPAAEVLSWIIQALDGLQHAHARGVIHRDLKPSNLMLSGEKEVKIMDFGIARMIGDSRMTKVGQVIGTPHYISPEQVKGQAGDCRSDIYSMGVVLYELLTGELPFPGESEFDVMQAHIGRKPLSPDKINGELPESLSRAVLRALEKEPSRRFKDAGEFKQTLEKIRGEMSQLAVATKTTYVNRGNYFAWGFLGASLLLALILVPNAFNDHPAEWKMENETSAPGSFLLQKEEEQTQVAGGQRQETFPVSGNDGYALLEKNERAEPGKPSPKPPQKSPQKPAAPVEKPAPPPAPPPSEETGKLPAEQETKTGEVPRQKEKIVLERPVMIPRGTPVNLILDRNWHGKEVSGDVRISFTVKEDVKRNGITVIAGGAKGYAILRKNGKRDELVIEMQEVESVVGKMLKSLRTPYKAVAFLQGQEFKMHLEYDRIEP